MCVFLCARPTASPRAPLTPAPPVLPLNPRRGRACSAPSLPSSPQRNAVQPPPPPPSSRPPPSHTPSQQSGDFARAGAVLSQAQLDSPALQLDAVGRARMFLRVAQSHLKAEDEVSADRFIKRCGEGVARLPPGAEPALRLEHAAAAAQLLDGRKKFLEASLKYGEVARLAAAAGYRQGEVVTLLESAVRCVLLAPPGPQRARAMAMLMRDEHIGAVSVRFAGGPRARAAPARPPHALLTRTTTCPSRTPQPLVHSMLQRMFNECLISAADAAAFEATLPPQCRAVNSEGVTLFADCAVKHNVLAASRVYSSISLEGLGGLLGVPPHAAQRVAARMVAEGKLAARLDQVGGFLDFLPRGPRDTSAAALLGMDGAIQKVCVAINGLTAAAGAAGAV